MAAAAVPIWAINSSLFPTAPEVNRKHAASFDVVLMEGVGHYPQVERPEEFQRHLREVEPPIPAAEESEEPTEAPETPAAPEASSPEP